MNEDRKAQLESRFGEINERLERMRLTNQSPIEDVDIEFYRGQLLEEIDEIEWELGQDS